MCGIAGWVSTLPERLQAPGPMLAAMQATLLHRGPDDSGQWFDRPDDVEARGGAALGFRRLSIVDLEGGHQPMGNEDGSVQVVFNGEIYNHLDLRQELVGAGHTFVTRCDTEAVVHGWEQWGAGLFARCNGMFDLAIWDGRTRELVLARDRFGKKPLFYAEVDAGRTLVFGSELAAVLAHPAVPDAVDPAGLQALLLFDYVASPRSIVRAVRTLEPGTLLRWRPAGDGSATSACTVWHAPSPPDPDLARLSETAALHELDRRLAAAVERRLMADVPLGVFLSGGIDSSLVAHYAARLRPDLETFAIGFADKTFDESHHARAVATHLHTRHHERTLDPLSCLDLAPRLLAGLDQPLADGSILPTYFLCGFARERVTVALGGDGGDEWFLGYPTFFADPAARAFDRLGLGRLQPALQRLVDKLPVSHGNLSLDFQLKRFVAGLGYRGGLRHVAWIGGLEPRAHRRVLRPEVTAELARDPGPVEQVEAVWQAWRAVARDDMDALAGLYARFYLGDGVLQKVDRASMLHSLEVRAPLLDPAVVDLARALPTHLKLRGRTTKYLLRRLAADKLPRDIVARPKKGFGVPLAAWLRGPLRPWLTDLLAPARLQSVPWLDPAGVTALVDDHLRGRADHRKVLWALLCFVAWLDRRPGRAGPADG